jgi:hypothetical protein
VAEALTSYRHISLTEEICRRYGMLLPQRTPAAAVPGLSQHTRLSCSIIFAGLYKGGGALNLNLKPSLTPDVADLLDRLVTSCKRLGMLYYPNMLNRYCQDDLASYVWIGIEEVKRFNMALFKVCRAFSSVSEQEGSINSLDIAGASRGLRARDLQFPLPRNTPLWNAVSKEEWVSAATEEVYCNTLNNTLEVEWISNSANTLELTEN